MTSDVSGSPTTAIASRPLRRGGSPGSRRLTAIGALVAAGLLLAACTSSPPAAPDPSDAPSDSDSAATPQPAALTGADIQQWIANAEWSFADRGLAEPITLVFDDGAAADDLLRTYEIGDGVEGDVDGDGVVDLAVPVSQLDGNGYQELWYIWLGADVDPDGGADVLATQVVYPIARTTRCGDVVNSVEAIENGFRIDQSLWMPHVDDDRDCASGGTGAQVREVTVVDVDGAAFPLQTAPLEAWGGVCPRSDWLDGILDDTVTARAAPHPSSPEVIGAGEMVSLYELPEAPLLTGNGARFFGFQPEDMSTAGEPPATMHCAFAG